MIFLIPSCGGWFQSDQLILILAKLGMGIMSRLARLSYSLVCACLVCRVEADTPWIVLSMGHRLYKGKSLIREEDGGINS
jgi:hypothetical protein